MSKVTSYFVVKTKDIPTYIIIVYHQMFLKL